MYLDVRTTRGRLRIIIPSEYSRTPGMLIEGARYVPWEGAGESEKMMRRMEMMKRETMVGTVHRLLGV